MSDTGSLDRMKAQAERRKKVYEDIPTVTGRVENTRVNPDETINELFATHKLGQLEEDTERELNVKKKKTQLIAIFLCSSSRFEARNWTRWKSIVR